MQYPSCGSLCWIYRLIFLKCIPDSCCKLYKSPRNEKLSPHKALLQRARIMLKMARKTVITVGIELYNFSCIEWAGQITSFMQGCAMSYFNFVMRQKHFCIGSIFKSEYLYSKDESWLFFTNNFPFFWSINSFSLHLKVPKTIFIQLAHYYPFSSWPKKECQEL